MKRFLLFLLSCQLLLIPSAAAKTVEMGKIWMQLNSETNGNNDTHLFEDVLSITTKFLNDYFRSFYQIDSTYFNSVTLRLRPFNIRTESDNSQTAQLEFAGVLSFSVEPVPTAAQLDKLTENAFTGRNLGKFTENFLRSNNDFLKNLQDIEIAVRDNLVAIDEVTSPDDESSDHSWSGEKDNEENKEGFWSFLDGWNAIMVYGVAIVAGILLAIAMVFLFRCCCCKSTRKADHKRLESADFPYKSSPTKQKQNKKQKKKSIWARKKEQKEEAQKLHDSMFSDRPPSPDKSEYSYNLNDMSMLSTDTGAMSLMSKASLGLTNYNQTTDVSYSADPARKNRRKSGASIPYGQDVSLLEDLNVLGQIEEDEESTYSASSKSSSATKKKKKQQPDSDLEIRKPKKKTLTRPNSKLRQPSPSLFGSKKGRYSGVSTNDYLTESLTDSTTSPSSNSGSMDFGSDVYDDLNDLSFQINASRGKRGQI